MEFSDICKAFYISQGKSGLKNHKGKKKIAMHLMRLAVKEEDQVAMCQSESTYINWTDGDASPREEVWANFRDKYVEADYVKGLKESFCITYINEVARSLGLDIPSGEDVNRHKLATAIARQMKAIADANNQNVGDIIRLTYTYQGVDVSFSEYINKAIDRYNKMKLIGGQEVSFGDYYVCNTIGDSQRFMTDKSQYKGLYLDNARIETIRSLFNDSGKKQYAGFDNKRCILIGSGGSGKTLMMQHLFLTAADDYSNTGVLPVFLELRNITQSDTIGSFLWKMVAQKDPSFTEEIADQMLDEGKCVVLMDGIDEIDPTDAGNFQLKLEAFTDKYKNTQVILSSRMCDTVVGLKGYVPLYVWPFDPKQAEGLIDKILLAEEKTDAKESVLEYLNDGFLGNESVFATHPMLLTFIVRNYPSFDRFKESRVLFYRKAYEALLSGHDENKHPYDRVFNSVDNADQFSTVFREFCGRTYSKGAFSFNDTSFEMYFNELTSYKEFKNPHKMTVSSFKHDVCSTACMMYEKELDLWYIDPGFQEFLFAEYYAQQNSESVKELGQNLKGQSLSTYRKLDAFDMLYNFTKEKVDVCIFLPFLDEIYKKELSDEESFSEFLIKGYGKVTYTVIDRELVNKYQKGGNIRRQLVVSSINEPDTVIMSYILKLLDIKPLFTYSTNDHKAECKDFSKAAYSGEYAVVDGVPNSLILSRNIQDQEPDDKVLAKLNDRKQTIKDENSKVVCFGHEYEIEAYDMDEEPEKFSGVIQAMIEDQCTAYDTYRRVREYYKQLKREQYRKKLR